MSSQHIVSLQSQKKMSDAFSPAFSQCCARFKEAIIVTGPEKGYEAKGKERRILFTLEIPYPFFKEVHQVFQEGFVSSTATSGENSLTEHGGEARFSSAEGNDLSPTFASSGTKRYTYTDFVEKCIFGEFFAFSDDQIIRKQIDVALLKISYKVSKQYTKTNGRARKALDERMRKFHVMEGQAKSVQELCNEIKNLRDELRELRSKYENS